MDGVGTLFAYRADGSKIIVGQGGGFFRDGRDAAAARAAKRQFRPPE